MLSLVPGIKGCEVQGTGPTSTAQRATLSHPKRQRGRKYQLEPPSHTWSFCFPSLKTMNPGSLQPKMLTSARGQAQRQPLQRFRCLDEAPTRLSLGCQQAPSWEQRAAPS